MNTIELHSEMAVLGRQPPLTRMTEVCLLYVWEKTNIRSNLLTRQKIIKIEEKCDICSFHE